MWELLEQGLINFTWWSFLARAERVVYGVLVCLSPICDRCVVTLEWLRFGDVLEDLHFQRGKGGRQTGALRGRTCFYRNSLHLPTIPVLPSRVP